VPFLPACLPESLASRPLLQGRPLPST
jgi:hypothetical protein